MQALVVEPGEVFDDGQLELRTRAPDPVGEELGLVGVDEARLAPGSRCPRAIRRASRTGSVRMWEASCQPTARRLKASITKAKNEAPSQERR